MTSVVRRHAAGWAPSVFLLVVLMTGCGGRGDVAQTPTPAASASSAFVAGLETPRYLSDRRMLEIVLSNETAEPVRIDTLRLESESFTRLDPTVRPVEVPPGRRVDVPIPYGQAICGHAQAHASVALDLAGAGDLVLLPITSGAEVQRMYDEQCRQEHVAQAADVGFGQHWTAVQSPDGPAVEGTVTIRRRQSDERVRIAAAEGNVIFTVTPLGRVQEPLLVLEPGRTEANLGVRIRATRCEPHAVAESKKTFRFPMWVGLGNDSAEYLEVAIGGHGRELLQDNIDDCSARQRAQGAVAPPS